MLSFYAADAVCGWGNFIHNEIKTLGVKQINPIGDCWFHDMLVMDEQGRVWLISCGLEKPVLFANNGEDAIDRVVNWTAEDIIK